MHLLFIKQKWILPKIFIFIIFRLIRLRKKKKGWFCCLWVAEAEGKSASQWAPAVQTLLFEGQLYYTGVCVTKKVTLFRTGSSTIPFWYRKQMEIRTIKLSQCAPIQIGDYFWRYLLNAEDGKVTPLQEAEVMLRMLIQTRSIFFLILHKLEPHEVYSLLRTSYF